MTLEETAILQLYKRTLALKELPRTGPIIEGVTRAEADTIAAHCHSVSVLAYLAAQYLASQFPNVHPERVAAMAVLHDLAECVTGDLPISFKRLAPNVASRVESQAFGFLFEGLASRTVLLELVGEYEAGVSAAAKIVRFADFVDSFVHLRARLGKELPEEFERISERLRHGGSVVDMGVGLRLAQWLDAIRDNWDSVDPKPLPKTVLSPEA